jgi:glucose-1-phosphate thymidylyltransferase
MIQDGAVIENSIVGPHATIGKNSSIQNTVISNSIVQQNAKIKSANITNSMIGNNALYSGSARDLSVGDYNEIVE